MTIYRKKQIAVFISLILFIMILPLKASGEVKPINELEDKLEGISKEEKAVLKELFALQQDINAIESEEEELQSQSKELQEKINDLANEIKDSEQKYDLQLEILQKVLVNYQRGGPTSYLEILLQARNLSEFLKSLNIMKDISHNVNGLLSSLKKSKKELETQKTQLAEDQKQLEQKRQDLADHLQAKQEILKKQQDYLDSLKENQELFQGQLEEITQKWSDCQSLFADIVTELNRIIDSGYFTEEDLNLDYGFFTIAGYLKEDRFNQVLSENTSITQTNFRFLEDQVIIEVPDKHLVLQGYFVIDGKSAIRYVVTQGSFYDIPLEESSIKELFRKGPLLIDFQGITGDLVTIDFKINEVWSESGTLNFVIVPQF